MSRYKGIHFEFGAFRRFISKLRWKVLCKRKYLLTGHFRSKLMGYMNWKRFKSELTTFNANVKIKYSNYPMSISWKTVLWTEVLCNFLVTFVTFLK